MPKGDGSGPQGKGPMTGRKAGRCSGKNNSAFDTRINQQEGMLSLLKGMFSSGNNTISGRGQGSGGGRRGGRGRGMGQGQGIRQGTGRAVGNFSGSERYETDKAQSFNRDMSSDETVQLKERARQIEEELNAIQGKINDLEGEKPALKVRVDQKFCTACGKCEDVCPCGAISVKSFAEIDYNLCTLCGRCVNECPVKALRIA